MEEVAMKKVLTVLIILALAAGFSTMLLASQILSLDGTRTGNGNEPLDDRYLTSTSMANATQVLLNAGFTIGTTPLFDASSIVGACTLYTGAVDVDFTAQEILDIQAFVFAGGGLVMQRDWGNFYPAADALAAAFGATYNTGPFGPGNVAAAVNMTTPHPIWNGPAGSVTTYDQVFSNSVSGVTGIGEHSTDPGQIGLAVTTYGSGRVVFLTDMDAWDDDIDDPVTPLAGSNNAIVWENIFHWTCATVPEPTTISLVVFGCLGLLSLRKRKG
jgi:hypothetical protein